MILSFLVSVLSFIVLLLVLVVAHEWGHFYSARRFGVRVYEFGFGFPPKIKGWMRRGTEYTLNWIPLGGFVKLKGEDGSDAQDPDSFAHKPAWQRLIILLAGVAMNFVLGYAIIVIVLSAGVDMARDSDATRAGARISDERLLVAAVREGSPAAQAGVQVGDLVKIVNSSSIQDQSALREALKDKEGKPVELLVERDGRPIEIQATPAKLDEGVVGLGIGLVELVHVEYAFPQVFVEAGRTTWRFSGLIFKTLGSVLGTLVRDGQLEQGVSGPVGIAAVTGDAARAGVIPYLQLAAVLSINLGVLNMLPFPALDGGRALFVLLEKIFRKKVRMEIERAAHLIGFALLMLLVLAVTYRDIATLIS